MSLKVFSILSLDHKPHILKPTIVKCLPPNKDGVKQVEVGSFGTTIGNGSASS
jgi:hypothetical protein